MPRGRKPTIGLQVLSIAKYHNTVAEIVRETGAKPNTVRNVLMKASVKGTIHLERFRKGMSARAIRVVDRDGDISNLNMLICSFCGKATK